MSGVFSFLWQLDGKDLLLHVAYIVDDANRLQHIFGPMEIVK